MPIVAWLVAAVILTSPFGEASATAIDDSDGLVVEVSVEYDTDASAVILRPFSDFEELPPTAMAAQPDGTWFAWVELPTAQNWQIAFEAFKPGGGSNISDGTSLVELGVDPVVIESEIVAPLPGAPLIPKGSWWLIVAIVVGILALGGLAYWAFAADPPKDSEQAPEPT